MSKTRVEFDLPVEIIQHIQSFLSPKESTQTCILSKPWFDAWATQPTLCLYQDAFRVGDVRSALVSDQFWNFSAKSLQRYKHSNHKLDKLILDINISLPSNAFSLLDGLINDALSLGVNVIHFCGVRREDNYYILPTQVFQVMSLTELIVSFCGVSYKLIDSTKFCSRLKSLELNFVRISDQSARDIIVGCPFIEKLGFCICKGLKNVDVGKMRGKLVTLMVAGAYYDDPVRVTYGCGGRKEVVEFRYVVTLKLSGVVLDNEFFRDFSSRFPCIENLELGRLSSCVDLNISSHSLHCLKLGWDGFEKVRLNLPNMSRFEFVGGIRVPSLSFSTAPPTNWKSSIRLTFMGDVFWDSWFVEFRKFLTVLSPSKISLLIFFLVECTVLAERIPCFPTPVVEDLRIFGPSTWKMTPGLLRGLFWCCRPSIISYLGSENHALQPLYEQLIQNENKDLYRMYYLKEVNLELFEDNLMEWQTVPTEKLINCPEIPHEGKRMRFQLSWGLGGLTGMVG